MSVAFRSAAVGTSSSGLIVTIPAPAGIQDDDILIAGGSTINGGVTAATLAGFTNIRSYDNPSGPPGGSLLFKRAASESGSYAYTFVDTNANDAVAFMIAISGAVLSGSPIHAEAISALVTTASGTSHAVTCPDITVTEESIILRVLLAESGSTLSGVAISGVTATEQVEQGQGNLATVAAYTEDALVSSDPGTATITMTTGAATVGHLFGWTAAINSVLVAAAGAAVRKAVLSRRRFD